MASYFGISVSDWGSDRIGVKFGEALANKFIHDMDVSSVRWSDIGDPLKEGKYGEAGGAVLTWGKEVIARAGVKAFMNRVETGSYLGAA